MDQIRCFLISKDFTIMTQLLFIVFLMIIIVASYYLVLKFKDNIDYWVKNNQSTLVFTPIIASISIFIFYLIFFKETIAVDILAAVLAAITFSFTLLNVYISNYWSEIANHRNATLTKVPHLEYEVDSGIYTNSGENTAKYVKLYVKDKPKESYYSAFNSGFKDKKGTEHKIKSNVIHEKICMDKYISKKLSCKFTSKKNYSNLIIHTDFSQRNIYIIYTYKGKDEKVHTKRFTPMTFDLEYKYLIGQENVEKVVSRLSVNDEKGQIDFINKAIDHYKEKMIH